jgi:hypothetical protein
VKFLLVAFLAVGAGTLASPSDARADDGYAPAPFSAQDDLQDPAAGRICRRTPWGPRCRWVPGPPRRWPGHRWPGRRWPGRGWPTPQQMEQQMVPELQR